MQYNELSDKELSLIKARCAKTTTGLWTFYVEGRDHTSGSNFVMTGEEDSKSEDIELICATNGSPVENRLRSDP